MTFKTGTKHEARKSKMRGWLRAQIAVCQTTFTMCQYKKLE